MTVLIDRSCNVTGRTTIRLVGGTLLDLVQKAHVKSDIFVCEIEKKLSMIGTYKQNK